LRLAHIGSCVLGIALRHPVIGAGAHALVKAASSPCLCFVRQPEASQRHAREADAEFLQRPAASDRLDHGSGHFVEFVVHNFPFGFVFAWYSNRPSSTPMGNLRTTPVAMTAQFGGSTCLPSQADRGEHHSREAKREFSSALGGA